MASLEISLHKKFSKCPFLIHGVPQLPLAKPLQTTVACFENLDLYIGISLAARAGALRNCLVTRQ